ncbi:MAG TPA: hypothetical protein VGH89_01330 [Pseudonocardia sp.]|jgi:hypothetical protein
MRTTKAVLTVAAALVAAGGSAAIGGTALADGHDCGCDPGAQHASSSDPATVQHADYHSVSGTGGKGGAGGNANANCAVPIGVSAGVVGQGGPVSQCNATAGAGGAGGSGVSY